ncbi:probable Rho GTPase-activating protein CG5521 isoform X2 [Chironomus tepperi]|uniref:probable Rho GTPase-activating protein CG5521 isoform X2 n=1 Tax=Chironomus tepperi TaxID=113505 RepID=UPI00391FAC12
MFTKKPQTSEIIKKSTQKVQDQKKEVFSRLKHIKTIIDHVDSDEAKSFFEANYSHIFYILHETFVQAETNLKQRVHKAHREELDGSIWLLGKVIHLLPELIAKRWQCHSTSRILMKLLHHGNSTKLRKEGVRYFLMWYQALGISEHGAPEEAHAMFNELVPGLTIPQKNKQGPQTVSPTSEVPIKETLHDLSNHPNFRSIETGQSVFHDQPTKAPDITPLILPASNERTVTPDPKDGLEIVLEAMVQSTGCLKWSDNNIQRHFKGFHFLLERFREVYLPVFCPNFDNSASIYEPKMDLPYMRTISKREELMSPCVVVLINWISKHTNDRHVLNKMEHHHIIFDDIPDQASLVSNLRHIGYTQAQIVKDVLYSNRDTVNFVNEVYRQAFLLSFSSRASIDAMKISISTYREWMSSNTPPPFLLENESDSANSSLESSSSRSQRLRTDSYIGAISKDNLSIRAGMQNVLQVFVTNAVNVFMVSTSHLNTYLPSKSKEEATTPLDEQTEICKRVLNIYRTMVMKTKMEGKTWEQLLMVLLQITSVILAQAPPNAKRNNLGGRLAQPIFQTLIVTWIRAHTNVNVHSSMWDKFLKVLSSLTHREELIVEWDKTMQTLTRVLARQVYNLNLQDLPLDRLAEQKGKRRRVGVTSTNVWQNSQASTENQQTTPTTNSMISKRDENQEPRTTQPILRHIAGTPLLNRSYSEGSLATTYRKSRARRRMKVNQVQELPVSIEQTLSKMNNLSQQMSVSMETLNMSKISNCGDQGTLRRALSLDSIRQKGDDNESYRESRSPSPTASSGLDGNSIKDSPHAIDAIASGGDSSSLETHDENLDRKSILAGGTCKGWLPDVACIMWRRMLGALGDVNKILNPKLHAEVFRYLVNITESLIKIKLNQGISSDNQSTPNPPSLVPPVAIVLPWCYGALTLDSQYQLGKVYAMQLICMIARNSCLTGDQLPLFYHALHKSLTGENRQMAATALKYLGGSRFLSLLMPGHSLLYLDLTHACTMVLTSLDVKGPRAEAISLLGSLLCFPKTSLPGPVLQPSEPHIDLMECPDLQEHVLNIVLRCARREPTAKARSIAITSLGKWIIQNLTNPGLENNNNNAGKKVSITSKATKTNPRLFEAFQVILQALQFKHRVISRIACETLRLCSEKGMELARIGKLSGLIIEALCYSLEIQNIPNPKECDKNVLTSMLLCLGELCMAFPVHILMEQASDEQEPLLAMIFRVLHRISTDKHTSDKMMYKIDDDFDMTITIDDVREQCNTEANYQTQETIQQCKNSIQLCAKTVAMHLVTNISHFPLGIGATRLSSLVDEHDDMINGSREIQRESSIEMYASQVITAPNMQVLMLSSELVASFIELPTLKLASANGLITANKQVRMIMRDLNGKACWDASLIFCEPRIYTEESDEVDFDASRSKIYSTRNNIGISLDPMISTVGLLQPRHTLRHRPAHQLPIFKDIAPDLDQLDDLLQFIGHSSPECLEASNQSLNVAGPSPLGANLEAQTIAILLNQRAMESDYVSRKNQSIDLSSTTSDFYNSSSLDFASIGDDITIRSTNTSARSENRYESTRTKNEPQIFHFGRLLFNQFGLSGWERRKRTYLLNRTDKLLRELRNLDAQKCRETHKMAVIYVASGQEDKNSILRNSSGSSTYEMFVSALGWEIELETHHGFLGGLPRQGCGQTAPYYATPFLEVIFHVSTRIPSDTHEAILNKTRHLGNDEVHIVWSEHNRDYRRDILPTEFCDVLIVIYPLKSGLFRVSVNRKPDVPWFGPICDEMVVSGTNLASLVRSSAINASRAKRYAMPFYQQFYEERNRSLETVASRHKESKTFEEFMTKIYSPVMSSHSSVSIQSGTITAAALIDHHHTQHSRNSVKNSSNWLHHHITQRQQSDLSESPSMLRKLPFCHNLPKKSSSSTTIPLSPTTLTGRRIK